MVLAKWIWGGDEQYAWWAKSRLPLRFWTIDKVYSERMYSTLRRSPRPHFNLRAFDRGAGSLTGTAHSAWRFGMQRFIEEQNIVPAAPVRGDKRVKEQHFSCNPNASSPSLEMREQVVSEIQQERLNFADEL